MLRTGDLVQPGHYTFLTRDVDGGDQVTDYLEGRPCLVLGLDDIVWNAEALKKKPHKREKKTRRVLLFDSLSCKVGWTDMRWVQRIK